MSDKIDTILFEDESGEEINFTVLEQTTVLGNNYLMVVEEDEGMIYFLREIPEEGDYVSYEIVEKDEEFESLAKIFKELVDDIDIEW